MGDREAFLFDVDGVFFTGALEWRGEMLGGYRLLRALKAAGKRVAFVGSGSNWSTMEYWYMVRSMGFPLELDEVWPAPRVASQHLKDVFGRARCLVVGEDSLAWELRAGGHKVVKGWREADAVVVAHDRFLNGRKLEEAVKALRAGAYLLAVNKVRWYYTREGPLPSPGSIVRILEEAAGREAVVAGKPSLLHFTAVLNHLGVRASEAVMVGDSPDTDLAPAKALGMKTVLVAALERRDKAGWVGRVADYTVKHVDDIVELLR